MLLSCNGIEIYKSQRQQDISTEKLRWSDLVFRENDVFDLCDADLRWIAAR